MWRSGPIPGLPSKCLIGRTPYLQVESQMKSYPLQKYFFNCFLLVIPALVWNIVLAKQLPEPFQPYVYGDNIPSFLAYGESVSRIVMLSITCLMPIHITTSTQKRGILLYTLGMVLYFLSWLALIYFPGSSWSKSVIGFMSPALTPFLWLAGISLIGNTFYCNLSYRRWFFVVPSIVFLVFHNLHAYMIYVRTT